MKINIIDLKKNLQYLEQYIVLRNSYTHKLLTDKVRLLDTKEWIKNKLIYVLIAVENNTLLGVVILYLNKNNEIAIFTKNSNKGIGSILLSEMEKLAIRSKIPYLYSWVENTNEISIALFIKQKYIKIAQDVKSYNNINHQGIIFKKELFL